MKEFKISTRTITDRKNISISGYMRGVDSYPIVTPEEEAQLALDIQKGGRIGERAKHRLVEANLRFVISVANQYKQGALELPDLISEGNIGLMKAADTFDATRGFKFISYAVWWIRQSIMTAIDKQSTTLRLPSNQIKMLQIYRKLDNAMMQNEQRHVTLQEFCEATGLTDERAMQIISASLASIKMDAPVADDADSCLGDFMASDSKADGTLDHESLCLDITDAISHTLKDREANIVCHYYGIGCAPSTLESIAEFHHLSYERTRQVLKDSLVKIKNSKYSDSLALYLAA